MIKCMEISDPRSCLNRAIEDEPVFVLLGRDESAPATIEKWCDLRIGSGKNEFEDAQIQEALELADAMRKYQNKGDT
jgi:hypothetical protein